MITILKTILIVLLVYYGVKILFKLLKPYIMRFVAKKAGQQFEKAFQNMDKGASRPQETGKVTIDKNPPNQRSSKNTVGEYVDFEEVE